MKTIQITGSDKNISNILRENKIRAKRGLIKITGEVDIESDAVRMAEATKSNAKIETDKEAKSKKKQNKTKIKTKEEKITLKNK